MLERITKVKKDKVMLKSGEWVQLSDKLVIMGVIPKVGDIAHTHTFNEIKIAYDITPQSNNEVVDEDEVLKQLNEFEDLLGGY